MKRVAFLRCSSTRQRPVCLTLPPARPREEIDVYRAAKSCPFDLSYRSATVQPSTNAAATGPASVSPRWGAVRSERGRSLDRVESRCFCTRHAALRVPLLHPRSPKIMIELDPGISALVLIDLQNGILGNALAPVTSQELLVRGKALA